jgi:hypothetical protein
MDRTRLGWALVVVGIVIALVSAFAEPLGLGDDNGLGMQQVTGVVVGVVVAVVGAAIAWRLRRGGAATVPHA